ncbi:histidine phosphatase family protein [Pelagibacterium lacus]|uniref:Histidine phosphatase family protein n=1 Tax=Pelagibacterium lacus TaxID=2282655 RepID=A0A369W7J5_9HYPH|nr:histidine phosphatase family protein [Pelagibacterium lacus]RDE10664.1 histidine phosphatase family protein [Pelagibacterium lacus]
MKDIFVVTHTEAAHHLENRVGGWFDSDLTHRGLQEAEAIAERLASLIGSGAVEIYSSDLRRASQTAAAIARRLGQTVQETSALREISYGVAGGKPQAWLDARYTPAPDDNRLDCDGGIDGAETRRDVARRVFPFIDGVVRRRCEKQIIVTHGFTLSMVIAAWMKIPIDATGFLAFPAKSGSITHLRQDDFFRNRAVLFIGDRAHLSGI